MLTRFFLFFSLLAFANTVQAQDNTETNTIGEPETREERNDTRRFGAQILAGFNAAQLDGDEMEGYNHLGVNAGLRAYIRIMPLLTTSVGIMYSQTGATVSKFYPNRLGLNRIDLDYVQIPILVHYRDWRMQAGAGLSYSRLFNAKFIDNNGLDLTATTYKDVMRNYEIAMHGEVTFFLSKKWGINLQYARSIMNVNSKTEIFANTRYTRPFLYAHYFSLRGLYQF